MSRESSIWFREQTGWYYTTHHGQQVKLSKDKAEAKRLLHKLLSEAEPEPVVGGITFRKAADLYLAHCHRTAEPGTFYMRKLYLQKFVSRVKGLAVSDLKVRHVSEWEAANPDWSRSTIATVRSIVLACLNWADKEGLIDGHPLRKLKAGRYDRRERILTPDEKAMIRAAVPDYLLDFLDALALTGARPYSEVARLTADLIDWEAGIIPLAKHKNAKKGKPRTIYLTPQLEAILRRKVEEHPTGILFRTRRGVRWTAPHMHYWLRKLERTLNIPRLSLYAWRHTMVTEALERGLTGDVVSELVGNSPQTITKYYSKLSEKLATLRAAAAKAVG